MGPLKVINLGKGVLRQLGVVAIGLITMLNLGPAATMALSMLISLAVYAVAFGWKFAVGFIILLFAHEAGHLIASRVVGVRATIPMFIPFFGAVISLRKPPVNAKMEANIAIGGPAMGTLTVLICLVFYFWTDSMLMLVLAYTACLLNLFNLIPCMPLDGGRIAGAISPHMWWAGSAALGFLSYYTGNFFIFVIFLFSLSRLWQDSARDSSNRYYDLSMSQRLTVAWWYFGLLAVLGGTTVYFVKLLG